MVQQPDSTQPTQTSSETAHAEGASAMARRKHVSSRQAWGPPWLSPMSYRARVDLFWLIVVLLFLAMGIIFFGWRGLLSVATVTLATLATYLCTSLFLQWLRPRQMPDSAMHILTLGLLLGVSLPVMREPWIPISAGAVLGVLCHCIGRSHRLRIHPVGAALVIAWVLPGVVMLHQDRAVIAEPAVLQLDHLITGDLFRIPLRKQLPSTWWEDSASSQFHAQPRPEPMTLLLDPNLDLPTRPDRLALLLSQSRLPRVEEILIGCVPGAIGATSKAIIILIGLMLMYRRVSWFSMAWTGLLSALAMLFLLPVQIAGHYTIMAMVLSQMDLSLGFIYVGYFLLASPLFWILLILSPVTAPMSRRGKIYYGMVIGAGTVLGIWLTGNWAAGYIALVAASALTRLLDGLQQSPLVKAASRESD